MCSLTCMEGSPLVGSGKSSPSETRCVGGRSVVWRNRSDSRPIGRANRSESAGVRIPRVTSRSAAPAATSAAIAARAAASAALAPSPRIAAARTSVLTPGQILERLAERLDLLKGGRDAEARQRTLRATIEWSHDLLSADEQDLFARLSVFAGGCAFDAAATVCSADLDTLQSLVDKSLVRHAEERFWMLETIREFAVERLEETGGDDVLRERYSAEFLEHAELAGPELLARSSSIWYDRIEAEHNNIRAVLGDALEHGRTDVALRICAEIRHFWWIRGYWSEGRRWIDSALAAGGESDPQLHTVQPPGVVR